MMPSTNISVWTPKSPLALPASSCAMPLGMAPMPICRGRAVLDQTLDVAGDRLVDRGRWRGGSTNVERSGLDHAIDLGDMNAVGAVLVEPKTCGMSETTSTTAFGIARRGEQGVESCAGVQAEAEEAALVDRRHGARHHARLGALR
jgi:hypothetical protein